MNTNKFARSPACANCGKYEEAHFDGYCERQKPEVTSPLTDNELYVIWNMPGNTLDASCRAIAIAAKIATIREIAAMPSLNSYEAASRDFIRGIEYFQRKLLAGIGETK